MNQDEFKNKRVVNTSRSIFGNDDTTRMPPDQPPYNPGPDDPEADDEDERQGNTDPQTNAMPPSSLSVDWANIVQLSVIRPDPNTSRYELSVKGVKTNGYPFAASAIHTGPLPFERILDFVRTAAEVRHGD